MFKGLVKTSIAMLLVLAMSAMFYGCASNETKPSPSPQGQQQNAQNPNPSDNPPAPEKVFIGFSQCTTDSPYYVALQEAAQKAAEDAGADFRLVNAADSVQKQNQDIQDLITAGINVLILNPVDAQGVSPSIKACEEAGIKVITVDRPVDSGSIAFVGRDNRAMGKLVGEAALELMGGKGKASGKILELQGAGGNNVTTARSNGFHDAFEGENVEFIQSPFCDYNRAKAVAAAQDLIQANPDIKVIYAHNDDMAIGGLQVAEQAGLKDYYVMGVDGLMEAVKLISDGKYFCTTMNDPAAQGKIAAETAIKVANGESVPEFIDAGTKLLTKDNASNYIGDTMFATEK